MPPKNRCRAEDATKMMVDAMKDCQLSDEEICEKIVTEMLDGGDPNVTFDGTTLLIAAIEKNLPSCVDALLQGGADPNKANAKGTSPLLAALSTDLGERQTLSLVRKLLLAKALPGHKELVWAVLLDYHVITRLMIPKLPDASRVPWTTLLALACHLQNEDMIDFAIEIRKPCTDVDKVFSQVLSIALSKKNSLIVNKLMSYGVKPGSVTVSNLSFACSRGDVASVKALLTSKAAEFVHVLCDSAFLSAVQSGSVETVKVLLDDNNYLTSFACSSNEFAFFLLGIRGAARDGTPEMFDFLLQHTAVPAFGLLRDVLSRNDEMTANAMLQSLLSRVGPRKLPREGLEEILSKVPGKEKMKEKVWKWFRGEEWRDSVFEVKKEEHDES